MPTLFDPLSIGSLTLGNRIVMAPLTRARAGADRIPNAMMAEYYAQRASAGLILSEATSVTPMGVGYADTPGIWNDAQVEGWKLVTKAVHDAGGRSIGLNIVLPHEQAPNAYVTPELCFNFHYFAIRKMHFLMRARAITIFPGGFGTLDELFETLTLIQTGRMARVPLLMFGREFWEGIVNWRGLADAGTISEEDLGLFRYVETAEEAVAIIDGWELLGRS